VTKAGQWVTRGFEAFRRGSFGNAGQNLYVSRAGVLQRIHLNDVNRDGYVDAVFCNCQDHWEAPSVYVYRDPLGEAARIDLPADGAVTGAVADFNGDGFDDLALGMEYNGATSELHAFIYYGSPEGLSERYCVQVPAPRCTSIAAGDFNGDGRPDLALICGGRLRVFYQTELGFEVAGFVDLDLQARQLCAADLDGDGFADLYALSDDAPPRVLWGGADGIDPARCDEVTVPAELQAGAFAEAAEVAEEAKIAALSPLARAVRVDGAWHLFVPFAERSLLVPVGPGRRFGEPLVFSCRAALSVAAGDVNGDGHSDLVFAARDRDGGAERSWVYWGGPEGFDEARRTPLATESACDAAVGDLSGEGCADVVICQNQRPETYSIESLIFRGTREGVAAEPIRLATEGARGALIARTSDSPQPQVIFVNRWSRGGRNQVPTAIYLGGPDGFSPERRLLLKGVGAAGAAVCDVNDDGYPDVVLANSAENAQWLDPGSFCFLGGPDGFPAEPDFVFPTRHAWGVSVGDVDRDGCLEVILSTFRGPDILIFPATADGFDLEHPRRVRLESDGTLYDRVFNTYLADFNNDGWLDLFVAQVGTANRCFILWGGPDGFDFARRQTLPSVKPICAQAADLTGNGYLDLIVGGHKPRRGVPHDSFVFIYWNGPEGFSATRRMQLPANTANSLAVADFNNDGYLDIFASSYHDGRARDIDSFLYWGGPGGAFSAKNYLGVPTHSCSGCLAADVNEDGWIDLVVCNHKIVGDHVGESFVFMNGPDGFDFRPAARLPTIGAHGMLQVQPGNQRDRGPEEYYESEPFELPAGATARRIEWDSEFPPRTWVRAQLRFAKKREELRDAPWRGPGGSERWFGCGATVEGPPDGGQWTQYRLALGAVNGGNTPRVHEVRVSYA